MKMSPTADIWLKRSLSVLGAGLGPFTVLALFVHIPTLAPELAEVLWLDPAGPEEDELAWTRLLPLLALLLEVLAVAGMVYGTLRILGGEPFRIGESLRFAAARWPSVMGLAILVIVTIIAGMLCFMIPGFVLMCGLFVAGPALLVERLKVTAAMKRSWSLTAGYKLEIFTLVLVIIAIQLTAGGLGKLLSLSTFGATLAGGLTIVLIHYGFSAMATALSIAAATVVYHDLRVFREGLEDEELTGLLPWREALPSSA